MTITRAGSNQHRARITSQGQITVPKAIRDQLGVKPGDELEFEPGPSGMLVHPRPRRSVLDFAGIASSTVVPLPRDLVALERLLAEGRDRAVNAKMARIAAGRTTK